MQQAPQQSVVPHTTLLVSTTALQSAMQAVEQKRAFDAQLAKANADMTEQKAAFDAQLEKAERSAAEMKAAADEVRLDFFRMYL
jgi:hypothetical protein